MADFSTTLKNVFSKSVKFVGKTAKSAAKSTKYKLDELSNLSKRRDLISELGNKVFELAQAGLVLPAEAAEIAKQITMLDGDLAVMRADHAAERPQQPNSTQRKRPLVLRRRLQQRPLLPSKRAPLLWM